MRKFEPGFRLSGRDLWVILIAVGFVIFGLQSPLVNTHELMLAGLDVTLQFFLFCNVFRVPLFLELSWASVFLVALFNVHTPLHAQEQVPFWSVIVGTGILAIVVSMCLPRYHGVGWRWINPRLRERWEKALR